MTRNKSVFTLVALLLALLCLGTAAVAPTLSFTFKDVVAPVKGVQETDAYAINDSGVIAGDYVDSASVQHAMILAGKKLTTADNKNCQTTWSGDSVQFYGINSSGTAVGWCTNPSSGSYIGYTYAKGKFSSVTIKGALDVQANGLNNKGAIVGDYIDSNGAQHGFMMAGKKFLKLDPPGANSLSQAWAINDKGEMTVFAADSASKYISFTTSDGKKYTAFNPPGQGSTGVAIHGIANTGDIDATIFDTAGDRHGILYHGGKYYQFDDTSGVGSTRADGINNKLQMVGRYGGSGSVLGIGFFAQAK